jgi:UDPglucose 6-dehydrogenase
MKVGVIGTGYVGLPTGVGLAELGHEVTCCDKSSRIIESLSSGRITLYEDGLEELFLKHRGSGRLRFTTSLAECVEHSQVVIIAVGTPPHPVTKEADLRYVHAVASSLAEHITDYTVVIVKSTVPVGTGDTVESLIKDKVPEAACDVVSIPEFLREGFAVYDFFHPDRIVIGADSPRAAEVVRELYGSFSDRVPMVFVRRRSSEIIKYAANAFLAIKIHYINEMADLCEKTGADVREVARGMGLDSRIGPKFLNPGPGYGGSCFPKDTAAIAYVGRQNNVELSLVNAAIDGNRRRKAAMADKALDLVAEVDSPKIAVLGLAFKEGTDDCRESPAIQIIERLLEREKSLETRLRISAYDPQAVENARHILDGRVEYAGDPYQALSASDLMLVLTEWPQFRELDLEKAKLTMRGSTILDTRNILNADQAMKAGFTYIDIGDGGRIADCVQDPEQ